MAKQSVYSWTFKWILFWRPYTELQNAGLNPPAHFKCDVAPVCQVIPTDHFTSWVQENASSQKSRMVRAFSYWDVKWGNLSGSSVPAGRLWNKPSNGFSSQVDSGDEALSTAAPTTIIPIPCWLFPFNMLFGLDKERVTGDSTPSWWNIACWNEHTSARVPTSRSKSIQTLKKKSACRQAWRTRWKKPGMNMSVSSAANILIPAWKDGR